MTLMGNLHSRDFKSLGVGKFNAVEHNWQAVDTSAVQLKLHAKPQTFERNPKPHPFWCQDRNHPPDTSNDPKNRSAMRSAAATVSSPSSCGVHQCCAMATAWHTASSINTCEHPSAHSNWSNQEIACLSTERSVDVQETENMLCVTSTVVA